MTRPLPLLILLLAVAAPAAAQLRPLPPAEWHEGGHAVACGAGHYADLGVGLLGARGRLESLGDCEAVVDVGGARVRLTGVAYRSFTEESSFARPVGGADPDGGPVRRDAGDFVLETLVPVRLGGPWMMGFRFGARLPTTDNTVGLGRDRTDVHMVTMAGYEAGPWAGHVEAGVGINGTRHERLEQQDVLLYGGRVAYHVTPGLRLHAGAVGHVFWLNHYTLRGNENLGEVRVGGRWGGGVWLELEAIAGYTDLSPSWGLRLRLGRAFDAGG